jgi:hypothetical protein
VRNLARIRLLFGAGAALLFAFGYQAAGFIVFAVGEVIERVLYFRTVDAPKMPGQPSA